VLSANPNKRRPSKIADEDQYVVDDTPYMEQAVSGQQRGVSMADIVEDIILVVDDDEGIRDQLRWALEPEYQVLTAGTAREAQEVCRAENPSLVLLDITLSDRETGPSGMDILPQLTETDPFRKVIMVTGSTEKIHALEAMERGIVDYYQKPIDLDELKTIIRRALYMQKLERENREYRERLARKASLADILGNSEPMLEVFHLIRTVAATDYAVLITGSSGTGKELVAHAIHEKSGRREKPFVAINCAAIPEDLLESELFGHEKGAFTGAQYKKEGRFEVAHKGTVFLDEIGDLSGKLQVKILRFLQDHTIEHVGSTKPIELDVRILAATNTDLKAAIKARTFREDLYYRLSVINISLPDLKDRGDDLRLLAEYFLGIFAEENKKKRLSFSSAAHQAMAAYTWPGNVREMENRIKRAVILTRGPRIDPGDLGLEKVDNARAAEMLNLAAARERAEKETITRAMSLASGNVSKAAKMLGTSRTTLYYLLEKIGVGKPHRDS